MIEFGCGDGHQLSLAEYPGYIGLDVSRSAIGLCQRRFTGDRTKSFFLYDGACFTDRSSLFTADLAISLDVIFHLIEDAVFDTYMTHLFAAGEVRDRLRDQLGKYQAQHRMSSTGTSPGGRRSTRGTGGCSR